MDAMSVINVTIYDLLLNCYLTVTTIIDSSGWISIIWTKSLIVPTEGYR